jgi:universal stress protein E
MWAVAAPGDIETDARTAAKILRLAAALGAQLEIFHCVYDADVARPDRFGSRGIQLDIREFVEQRHRQLERNAEHLRGHGVEVRSSVRWDFPAYEGIVRQALRRESDLVIAPSVPRTRAERLGLPPTDLKLIETCPCPLLLLKSARPYGRARVVAAVDPGRALGVSEALDGAIVESAQRIASALSDELLVFHAFPRRDRVAAGRSGHRVPPKPSRISRDEGGPIAADRVRDLVERYAGGASELRLVEGRIERSLSELVCSEAVDVVVMGIASRSSLRRALAGHKAERLLDRLDCDLLIIKTPGWRSPVTETSAHHVDRLAVVPGRYLYLEPRS